MSESGDTFTLLLLLNHTLIYLNNKRGQYLRSYKCVCISALCISMWLCTQKWKCVNVNVCVCLVREALFSLGIQSWHAAFGLDLVMYLGAEDTVPLRPPHFQLHQTLPLVFVESLISLGLNNSPLLVEHN